MRGTSELQCIVPTCENQATEMDLEVDPAKDPSVIYPRYCVCHVFGHRLRVMEFSNAFSQIQCMTMSCDYEERIEVAVGCKEIKGFICTDEGIN